MKYGKLPKIYWSDDDDVERFFNDDDDQDSDFEGFDIEDIAAGRNTILAEISMNDFVPENDKNLSDDVENGWHKIDFHNPFHRKFGDIVLHFAAGTESWCKC